MRKKIILSILSALLFIGCNTQHKPRLDGKKLIEKKCSQCHNLDLPPKTFEDEKAPPMMAVAFHIRDFIKAPNESEKVPRAISFVKDYVIKPSVSKSFCDKHSLESYGVMPSQKGKVSEDELEAIAEYMFEHFTLKNLNDAQALQNKLNAMPKGERLALQNNCLSCHKVDKKIVGPSFKTIANTKGNSEKSLIQSIHNGSKGKYASSNGAIMPAFKSLSDDDLKIIVEWILSFKK
ncbi:c-type cytochrome [Sulfurimonas paralvinellae]|uniref:C-type cytochrome n=1 Tax=Sulfurimonas paralvinellae TaxID=317658 RepID=A0A7M1B9N1_9BACT|nr:c-type cytochrome [Sulfurimonas paralvinellae]QOP46414.1 c-type cytochrome [Sulfurimonas paralvinellae]